MQGKSLEGSLCLDQRIYECEAKMSDIFLGRGETMESGTAQMLICFGE